MPQFVSCSWLLAVSVLRRRSADLFTATRATVGNKAIYDIVIKVANNERERKHYLLARLNFLFSFSSQHVRIL